MAECLVLAESACAPAIVIGEVGGGPRRRDRDIDLRVEPGVILGDPDESVRVTGCYGQFLEIVRVPVDVAGALEIRAGLKLGEGLFLFVLLDEPEPELGLELGPGGERERYGRCAPFRPVTPTSGVSARAVWPRYPLQFGRSAGTAVH